MTSIVEAPPLRRWKRLSHRTALTCAALAAAALLYSQLRRIADFITYDFLRLDRSRHLGPSVEFFLFEVPKVLLLLTARCKETFRVVRHVVEQAGLAIDVVKDESIERMMALGLLSTPGVAIDGKIVISGRIPKADEIRNLLGLATSA